MYNKKLSRGLRTARIIPDSLVGQLHGIGVLRLLEMFVSMAADIPSTADVATNQTDPQILWKRNNYGKIRKYLYLASEKKMICCVKHSVPLVRRIQSIYSPLQARGSGSICTQGT